MTLFLGIDGGGTGCRAVIADADGCRLGEGRAGPANIMTDPEGARDNLLAATAMALGGSGRLAQVNAVLGLAGANIPGCAERLAKDLPFVRVRIVSDAVIALQGAMQGAEGIAATIGTGSVFAANRGGAVHLLGGRGLILGDEGSGAWMGRRLLAQAVLAADGMEAMTPLLAMVLDEAGGAHRLVEFAKAARPGDFARHALRLTAMQADPAAAGILAAADNWIMRYIDRLTTGADLPIAFLGGLGPVFANRLAARYGARIRAPLGSALDGALWMALTQDTSDVARCDE